MRGPVCEVGHAGKPIETDVRQLPQPMRNGIEERAEDARPFRVRTLTKFLFELPAVVRDVFEREQYSPVAPDSGRATKSLDAVQDYWTGRVEQRLLVIG